MYQFKVEHWERDKLLDIILNDGVTGLNEYGLGVTKSRYLVSDFRYLMSEIDNNDLPKIFFGNPDYDYGLESKEEDFSPSEYWRKRVNSGAYLKYREAIKILIKYTSPNPFCESDYNCMNSTIMEIKKLCNKCKIPNEVKLDFDSRIMPNIRSKLEVLKESKSHSIINEKVDVSLRVMDDMMKEHNHLDLVEKTSVVPTNNYYQRRYKINETYLLNKEKIIILNDLLQKDGEGEGASSNLSIIFRLRENDFYKIKTIRDFSEETLNKLNIDLNEKDTPYKIALIYSLGFFTYLVRKLKTKENAYAKLVEIFDIGERTLKGNILVLNPKSTENRDRYTSHLYLLEIQSKYKI